MAEMGCLKELGSVKNGHKVVGWQTLYGSLLVAGIWFVKELELVKNG